MIAAIARGSCLLVLLFAPTVAALAEEIEDPGLPILESGSAVADFGTRRLTVQYSLTVAGPLVEVEPLIGALGGEVEIGPLGESHELTLNELEFAFGPGSDALVSGKEIVDLSQAAIKPEDGGAQVPLDLLDNIYGHNLGYEFSWNHAARILLVRLQPERELDLQYNLVHVQGVTTAVFQFSTRPRYRIRRAGRSVLIDLISDRLASDTALSAPADELVRGIDLSPTGIRMRLASGAVAEEYVLDEPFRLVFDVFQGRRAPAQRSVAPPENLRQRRLPGIRTIIVDPGHGGTDTGAVGPSGLEEKRLTLQIARTLKDLLESRLPVRVVLTRTGDSAMPLESRAAVANQNKGDLFLSLHFNSAPGRGPRGAETFILSRNSGEDTEALAAAARSVGAREGGDPLFDLELELWDRVQMRHLSDSRTLAGLVQDELNALLDSATRTPRQAPLRVLAGVAMPAVLVELGFLTNREEEALLQDPGYRVGLADALAKAVVRYRAGADGTPVVRQEPAP